MQELAETGIRLDKAYSFSTCTPSRMAWLSGRLPIHNGIQMVEPQRWDGGGLRATGANPENGYDGLSPNVTCLPAKLRALGYRTHMVGKGDGFGMATNEHLPVAPLRGFESALHYFSHANDAWTYNINNASAGINLPCPDGSGPKVVDLFFGTNPNGGVLRAHSATNTSYFNCVPDASSDVGRLCEFEEQVLTRRALDVLDAHPVDEPLFLFYSARGSHTNLTAPEETIQRIRDSCELPDSPFPGQCNNQERWLMLAMMQTVDEAIGAVVDKLKAKGMYDNSLIVLQSDNGGPIGVLTGGNNFPLRGGKGSSWEGGFRVGSFLSGGFVPPSLRGTAYDKPTMVSDWYATFCEIAKSFTNNTDMICTGLGADPTGERAGIQPVESVPLWPYLTGQNPGNAHETLPLSPVALTKWINGVQYKLITSITGFSITTSPNYPNCTTPPYECTPFVTCCVSAGISRPLDPFPVGPPPDGVDCGQGCLFNLDADPTESVNLCESQPTICHEMKTALLVANETYYEPFRGCYDFGFICNVFNSPFYNSTNAPFVNVEGCDECAHTTLDYNIDPNPPHLRTRNSCQCQTSAGACIASSCIWNPLTQECNLKCGLTQKDYFRDQLWSEKDFNNMGYLL